jgi:hypothetical protein
MLFEYTLLVTASFCFVFLKAFQQRNVAFDNYVWVLPTSWAMAATEVYVVVNVARNGWHLGLVFAIGCGSGVGALAAMLVHRRWVK